MKHHKNLNAFTLMELITVVIIISVIAAFAIPNYQTSVAKAHEKDMIANMRAIASAENIYFSENNTYWPISNGGFVVASINANLRLGIIENQTRYFCMKIGAINLCQAQYPFPGAADFILQSQPTSAVPWAVFCSSGACPTCDASGCPN